MKASDVRAKTDDELKASLEQLAKERFNLRFQKASGQLENTTRSRQVRRDMARIKTILAERARVSEREQRCRSVYFKVWPSATRGTRR